MTGKMRKDYAVIGLLLILMSVGVDYLYNRFVGGQKFSDQLIYYFLTVILAFYTALNKTWAKWVQSILLLISGVLSLIFFLVYMSKNFVGSLLLLVMGVLFTFSGVYIIKTRNKV